MASVASKFDRELAKIHASYLDLQQHGRANVGWIHPFVERGKRFYVYVSFEGDLAALTAAGLASAAEDRPGEALGLIDLADLERVASLPQVRQMRVGSSPQRQLDASIPYVKADQVWTVNRSAGSFTGRTGKNVIVGIVDSGIDFGHPDFIKPNSDPRKSRILRIWDQGIRPDGPNEKGPDAALLTGGLTYGVEYSQDDIDDHLSGAGRIFHRDCDGHGTHVASTAAGNGAEKAFKYIGVAPEADIIMVKYFDPIVMPVEDSGGNVVPDEKRLRDAVKYILEVALEIDPDRPVVVNMSLGEKLGPHDGMSPIEVWLNEQFPLAAVGRACVVSAGNYGRQLNGVLEMPGPGETIFSLRVSDERSSKSDQKRCDYHDNTRPIGAQLWYPLGAVVEVALQVPGANAFTASVTLGNNASGFFAGRKKYEIAHRTETINVGAAVVSRHVVDVTLTPEGNMHGVGYYRLKVKGDRAVRINVWCGGTGLQQIRFADPGEADVPLELERPEKGQIGAMGGAANLIAVGSFAADPHDPFDDPFGMDPDLHGLDMTSSRGPLVSYTGGTPPQKPEIAAPGVRIEAAKTGGSCWWSLTRLGFKPYGYVRDSGTSMASPHVAGAVALMFQAKPSLTLQQVRQLLLAAVDPATDSVDPHEIERARDGFGAGRLNVKRAVDAAEIA
jgi:subtilisin family serine protease